MSKETQFTIIMSFGLGFVLASLLFTLSGVYIGNSKSSHKVDYESNNVSSEGVSVVEKDDGLYAIINGNERILSVRMNDIVIPSEGVHVSIPSKSVSPDGKYIYFCEQQTSTDEICVNYLYDVLLDGVYRLEENYSAVVSVNEGLKVSWENNGTLHVNDLVSAQVIAPWLLIKAEAE